MDGYVGFWPIDPKKGRTDHQGIQSNYKLLFKLLPRTRELPTSWRSFWFCKNGGQRHQQVKAHNYFDQKIIKNLQLSTLIIRSKKITLISLFIILSFPAKIYEFGKFQTHSWSKKDPHLSPWIINELELNTHVFNFLISGICHCGNVLNQLHNVMYLTFSHDIRKVLILNLKSNSSP